MYDTDIPMIIGHQIRNPIPGNLIQRSAQRISAWRCAPCLKMVVTCVRNSNAAALGIQTWDLPHTFMRCKSYFLGIFSGDTFSGDTSCTHPMIPLGSISLKRKYVYLINCVTNEPLNYIRGVIMSAMQSMIYIQKHLQNKMLCVKIKIFVITNID